VTPETLSKRLLVVEDHAPLLRIIAKALQQAGYEVATARSGKDALLVLAEFIPDLIVSDIMMPGMDGYALAEKIRGNPRTDIIPIVFLTAKDTRADRIKGSRVGVDAYVTKPFEPEELIAAIQNIFKRIHRTHRRVANLTATTEAVTNAATGAVPAGHSPAVVSPRPDEHLTETETRVAHAAARGLSNKEIGSQLGISYRTVEMHVSHILAKKHLSNRVELARHMMERERQAEQEAQEE
jgi:DNA-binding NarL/FixJ family response regulator